MKRLAFLCLALWLTGCGKGSDNDGRSGDGKPSEADAQEAQARRVKESLAKLGKAMLAYAEQHQALPAPCLALGPQQGPPQLRRPGLSWRVQLLPHLGEKKLYDQFKLDEPWDSDHNKKLLDRMPKVYAPPPQPGGEVGPGMTFYQVFTSATSFDPGNEPLFHSADPKDVRWGPTRFPAEIPDGTSNTLMIVEAARPVPWTKPEDLPCAGYLPVPPLGHAVPGVFFACTADGAVHTLSTRASTKVLRTAITRAGGEVFSWEDLAPGKVLEGASGGVSGRVRFKGKPLQSGWVTFHTAEGREFASPLAEDGTFHVSGVPVGTATITVFTRPQQVFSKEEFEKYQKATPIPGRYSKLEASNLKFEVKPGGQTHNLDLNE
jgi:hypothetical protein